MRAATSKRFAGTLPALRTRLIGREQERETARALLLEEAVPLLTLTGTGGIGKTHLALAIALDVLDAFADGVVWVDLAPLIDPDLVPVTTAAAVGSTRHSGCGPLDDLAATLQAWQCLLLLDNCEHVVAATATMVHTILTRCPAVQVLATSRAPLHLRGEQVMAVSPLAVTDETAPSRDVVARSASGRLFVDRARAVQPSFALTDANAAAVAALCRHLDGLPLAIELAAARVNVLSPEALVLSMHGPELGLVDGPRDLPARQQTLAATITWSYALLDDRSQALLRRLAVFPGGFTLEAAQAVRPDTQSAQESLASFTTLVDQNLVYRLGGDGTPRFTMLETIRAFARERLDAAGETGAAQDAHAAWILGQLDRFHPDFAATPDSADWTVRRREIGDANFRAALTRLAETGHAEPALRVASALAFGWESHVAPQEGQSWLEWGLAQSPEADSAARGHALAWLAGMYWLQGRYTHAMHLAEASLAMARRLGDPRVAANATHTAGNIALSQHDYARASALMTDVASFWKQNGYSHREGQALQVLAGAEHGLGDDVSALRHVTEAIALFRAIGQGWETGALARLGRITRDQGDDHAAAVAYHDMLPLCRASGSRFGLVQAFAGLGEIASRWGQADIAAVLLGVIDTLVREAGAERIPAAQVNFDRAESAAAAALGPDRFRDLRAAGQRLRWDDAIALAGTITTPPPGGAAPRRPRLEVPARPMHPRSVPSMLAEIMRSGPDAIPAINLTNREQDVLALLCQRMTDGEIASQLSISRKTASNHVANILAKLGAADRRKAAAIAVRYSLV